MTTSPSNVASTLVLNGGSSSIRFAVFSADQDLRLLLDGKIDRIGLPGTSLTFNQPGEATEAAHPVPSSDYLTTAQYLLDWLEDRELFSSITAVGHRVVHGMAHTQPEVVTKELLAELMEIMPFDPDHLPSEIGLIEEVQRRHPQLRQVVCYDTAFHRNMPRVAKLLPIPRRYSTQGVERYGFHGLSYTFLLEELQRLDHRAANGRVIMAHLGNGASLAAVNEGQSIDTTMGFTPTSGLMMSTRTGDLDPGVVSYLAHREEMSIRQFQSMVNHESGLLGVSEISSDMRDLLAQEGEDVRAAEAVALFCYQAKKWLGALIVALGGLETLIFAGGIGENCPHVRSRICQELGFLGIELNESRNDQGAAVISRRESAVTVRVMHTDEELMIARSVVRLGVHTVT